MFYKILLIALTLSYAPAALAQNNSPLMNDDVRKAFEQTNQAMVQSVEQMDKTMQKVMPEITNSMSEMMINVFNSFPQLMTALEQNQVFSKTAEQMNRELQKTAAQLQQQANTAAQPGVTEEFNISGTRIENGEAINFTFSGNPQTVSETAAAMENLSKPAADAAIVDLNARRLPLAEFKLEVINGYPFIFHDDSQNGTFAVGNLNNRLNLKVHTSGTEAPARARSFIKNFKTGINQK